MPQRFKVYDGAYPHFITITVTDWLPIFNRDDYFRIIADSLTYCSQSKGLIVHGYVLMPNHFHLTASQDEGRISDVIRDMKGYTSRLLAPKLQADGRILWLDAFREADPRRAIIKVWQDEFHPEQVHTQPFFRQKLEYMHNNPVRAGFVEDPCAWKYSSAGYYYLQQTSPIPVQPIEW